LHEVSGRRSDIYPTFTRLCQIEVVRRAVQRTATSTVTLLSTDGAFSRAIASLCAGVKVDYGGPSEVRLSGGLTVRGVAARLAMWTARTVGQTLLAKLLTSNTMPRAIGAPVCVFHTIYPISFLGTKGRVDEKYLGVPNLLVDRGISPFIGVTFAADDGHQHLTMRRYLQACLLLRRRRSYDGVAARLVDRDLSLRSMLRGFVSGLSASLRQLRMERRRSFRDRWRLDGVDIYPLLQPEMRMAAYRTPRYLMHMLRMRAFLNRVQPDAVVSTLFEFCYGRATNYAIATSNATPLSIGAQHGPTGRKLMYRYGPGELDGDGNGVPMPEHLLLEGEEARTAFAQSGFPAERLHVLGAPRFDALAGVPRWSGPAAGRTGPKRVLVAFGASDGHQIMGVCRPVIADLPGYHFIMKPHPRSAVRPMDITATLGDAGASSYEIATGPLYDLLPTADVVVATYSSVGQEAAALGYPTIVLHLPDFASPSGLLDVRGHVRFAASADSLGKALRASVTLSDVAPKELERAFFWKIDGRAQERWADTIADMVKRHRSR
jgi:hypothetical protein